MSTFQAVRTASLVDALAAYGGRPALVGDGGTLTYDELARRVSEQARALGPVRRLVLVEGANTVDAVVAYLGALAGGHPVLLSGDAAVDTLALGYQPDVVSGPDGLVEVRPGTAHDLHPDLALMLSTSGSTGSPKLVRLSGANLVANAAAIADYLGLGPGDVAATTLPMHYCYGLSVINSHLFAGATLMLTARSVAEPEFWEEFREHRATSFAGVPYTFELLDRIGFAELDLPHLRYVTQAGGRLPDVDVRRYAELGRRRGFELFVMYGATEATARMAFLPPALAVEAPGAIGAPIPGAEFTLEPLPDFDGPDVGELVFHGPNVMLGYAESPADLALGRTVTSLHTGDVGRLRADGLYEVIGRCNRVAKVFGLRLDLDHVERLLAERGVVAAAADGGDRLILAVCDGARPVAPHDVQALVREELGLPPGRVVVSTFADIPRLPSGKTDYRAIAAQLEGSATEAGATTGARDTRATVQAVLATYAELLGRPDAQPGDSFVTLGGDSLSYVEVSLRLESLLGHLPTGWHTIPVSELVGETRPARPGVGVETNVLLRALAIVSIVGTHANLFTLLGGAHLLLAVAGFNFGRFQLTAAPRSERVRKLGRSIVRIVLPSVGVIATVSLWTDGLGWRQALLLNGLSQRVWSEPAWYYWFVEAIVYTLVVLAALLAVPAFDRLERRHPFWLPYALAVAALATRYGLLGLGGDQIHRAHVVFWLFALGWASAKASERLHRVLLSLMAAGSVPGFFDEGARNAYVALGLLALIWLPGLRVPGPVARIGGVLAASSLWIYLVHWQVYPWLEYRIPVLALLASLVAGVAVHRTVDALVAVVTRRAAASGTRCRRPAAGAGARRPRRMPGSPEVA